MNEIPCLGGASHADAAGDRSGEQLRLAMLRCMKFGQQDHALDMAREDRKYVICRTVRPT